MKPCSMAGSFVVLVWVVACGCGLVYETDYSRADIPKLIKQIRLGDSVGKVNEVLGDPFHVDAVYKGQAEGSGLHGRLASVGLDVVGQYSRSNMVVLYLEYSRPARGSSGHLRYEVDIERGIVIRVISGVIVD